MTKKKQNDLSSWIKNNIKKKECCFFQNDLGEDVCKCGYSKNEHTKEALNPENYKGDTWDREKHVQEVPTDAFGEICFGNLEDKISKYARVSSDTKPEVLYRLLTTRWKLVCPSLLISVTGGTKDFNMTPRLEKMFHRELLKVAQTLGAWFITGGTDSGVMKLVGQAVRDYTLSRSTWDYNIVAIGVAPWGAIHNKAVLVHKDGCFPAKYVTDTKGQGRLSSLNSNHTHFLLVDDGTPGQHKGETEFRTSLEKFIDTQKYVDTDTDVTIPVVCVVMEGDTDTLNTMYNAMQNGTPCVVLEGSGRTADVIAKVSKHSNHLITDKFISEQIKKYYNSEDADFLEHDVSELIQKIRKILGMPNLLTVFTVSKDNHGSLDAAILQALLKELVRLPGHMVWHIRCTKIETPS